MTTVRDQHDSRPILRLGHSPDPDDAFMWWPLFGLNGEPARIDTGRFRFEPFMADIETLNQRSLTGDLEITAISCAQYPWVADKYAITACGASMGDQYGPKLVSSRRLGLNDLASDDVVIAVPGTRTSAFGALNVMLGRGRFRFEVVPFEQIIDRVKDGTYAAGLVIHECQLTYSQHGLHLIEDVGRWWSARFDLPLPLGVNVVRRDLERLHGSGTLREVCTTLQRSLEFALAHREEGIDYAQQFGRGISAQITDQFVAMYVNRWTLDLGPVGRRSVRVFLEQFSAAGLAPNPGQVEFIAHPLDGAFTTEFTGNTETNIVSFSALRAPRG